MDCIQVNLKNSDSTFFKFWRHNYFAGVIYQFIQMLWGQGFVNKRDFFFANF